MTIRNVRKSLAGMQDLLQGVGTQAQLRGDSQVTVAKIDVPYAVVTESAMKALDISIFTRARVYSDTTTYTDYIHDPLASSGILPNSGGGFWVRPMVTSSPAVDTIADLRALEPVSDKQVVIVLSHTELGLGGGIFYADFSDTSTLDNDQTFIVTPLGKRWIRGSGVITAAITIPIGIGNRFKDLTDGFDYLANIEAATDIVCTLEMQAGHEISSNISIIGKNYGWITVSSIDAVVTVAATFSGNFMSLTKATGPSINFFLDMLDLGAIGYNIATNSAGSFSPGAGVSNAGSMGLSIVATSSCSAGDTIWFACNSNGVQVTTSSVLQAANIVISGCCKTTGNAGLYVNLAAHASCASGTVVDTVTSDNIAVNSLSNLLFSNGVSTGSSARGCQVQTGSRINATAADFSSNVTDGIRIVDNAFAYLGNATINNNGNTGITTSRSTFVDATNVQMSGNSRNVLADNLCVVNLAASTLTATTGTENILARISSIIAIRTATITNANTYGIRLQTGAQATGNSATTITGNGATGVSVEQGAQCSIQGGTISGNVVDINVSNGSRASFNGVTTTNGVGTPSLLDVTGPAAFNAFSNSVYMLV